MKTLTASGHQAFTMIEALVVVVVLFILAAMLMPSPIGGARAPELVYCINNLKEEGVALRVWEGDHGAKYPMNVSVADGGARELLAAGNVAACFQIISNELATPKILYCPGDKTRQFATNFVSLNASNISYFIGVNIMETNPDSLVSGDANLVQDGRPVRSGIFNLWTNNLTWSKDRHHGSGNILEGDGSVQHVTHSGLINLIAANPGTNTAAIP